MASDIDQLIEEVKKKYPHQEEFLQVVYSFLNKIKPFLEKHEEYRNIEIIRRMTEPDRIVDFRVSWVDSSGREQLNRGYRVQFNRALGPYKGGFRFHPSVDLSILKFLGFEQCIKNSLTGMQLGGAKGGADFNPSEFSDTDIMRFCQAFAANFFRYSGESADIPAGDIGVGEREIGYLIGYTNKLKYLYSGAFTGKMFDSGGSHLRPESTGYGCMYFLEQMLIDNDFKTEGKKVNISGAGNVALHACEMALQMGMKVQTLSDSGGVIFDEEGLNEEKLEFVKDLKLNQRGRISDYAEKYNCEYVKNSTPWSFPCEIALPCATQNEIDGKDAEQLSENGCIAVAEGANMPCTNEAVDYFLENGVLYAPGKASNAGGVSVSAFEMAQNKLGYKWTRKRVCKRLKKAMQHIYSECTNYGGKYNGKINYVEGANVAGFARLFRAMKNQGVV